MKTFSLPSLLARALVAAAPRPWWSARSGRSVRFGPVGRLLLRALCAAAGGRRSPRLLWLGSRSRLFSVDVARGRACWL